MITKVLRIERASGNPELHCAICSGRPPHSTVKSTLITFPDGETRLCLPCVSILAEVSRTPLAEASRADLQFSFS